jgi:hypothetical protein
MRCPLQRLSLKRIMKRKLLGALAKRKFKIHFRIPPYVTPRNDWRRLIHDAARTEMRAKGVTYRSDDRLAVTVGGRWTHGTLKADLLRSG